MYVYMQFRFQDLRTFVVAVQQIHNVVVMTLALCEIILANICYDDHDTDDDDVTLACKEIKRGLHCGYFVKLCTLYVSTDVG